MSISTPWMTSRTASASSSSAAILAIATGVATGVRSSGTLIALGGRAAAPRAAFQPPVMSTHGMSCANTAPSIVEPRVAVEALEVAHLALAEHEDAAGLQVLVEAGQRQAGLLDVRAGDGALEAAVPAQQLERQADGVGPALQQARRR